MGSNKGKILNVYNNKIYDLAANSSFASGIQLDVTSTNITANVQNNMIGVVNASASSDLRGISIADNSSIRTFNINYNTIYLNATSSAGNFTSAGIFLPVNTNSTIALRNNILVNLSTPNGTGRTTVIQRNGTALTNYAAASNNNVLFVSAPSATRLIYYDGSTGYQILAAYQAIATLSPRDNLSVSVLPTFISTTGSNANFLHLNTTANCGIVDGGNNNGIFLATDFDADARMITAPFITDIGADEVLGGTVNVWNAAASTTDWNTPGNWSLISVPNSATVNVYIPSVIVPQPEITLLQPGPFQVNQLVIEPGGLLTNKGTLQIAGRITGNAASMNNYDGTVVTGSIEMNGCILQNLAGNVFAGNDVNNFKVTNQVNISAATVEKLDIIGELGFGAVVNTTLSTGNNITLVSTALTTANVAKLDATNFISGDVIVERHILTGLGGGEHAKTWQALATPTGANSIGQTVKQTWMEGGNNASTGYGTHIPDPTGTTNGFDLNPIIQTIPSIKTYNYISNGFDPIANTSIQLYNKNGYFIFVRGDRSIDDPTAAANPTNLRSKGALFQPHTGYGPPAVTVVANGKYELIGNPYASSIDINYMKNNGKFSNLTNNVIVWDPLIPGTQGFGGYQVLSASSTPIYSPTPGGTIGNTHYVSGVSCTEIQSGQAFFMQTPSTSSITGSVIFDESVKSSNSRVVTKMNNATGFKSFRASLFSSTGICDGNTIMYDDSFTNDIDADDAGRPFNPGENFMIRKENNIFLTVEARAIIKPADSIFYIFKNLRKIKYQLVFTAENLQEEGVNATLIDNYLQQKIPLSLTDSSFIDFIVDDNKASYENRFIVVFIRGAKAVPLVADKNKQLTNRSFVVYPNPTENKTISIQFVNQPTGIYKLQLLNYAGQVLFDSNIRITNTNSKASVKPGKIATGSYQLVITAADGRKSIEQVMIN